MVFGTLRWQTCRRKEYKMRYRLTEYASVSEIEYNFDAEGCLEDVWVSDIRAILRIEGVEFEVDLTQETRDGENGKTALQVVTDYIYNNVFLWEYCDKDKEAYFEEY
jgi:hypothetical protein